MTSKTEDIVDSVRNAILSHRLLPGTHLREVSLGRLYGVSRTVVRQALQRLAKDGLVELAPGKIASVAQPTPKEAREVFDLRLAIERHALTGLIARATKKDIARLKAHLKQERSAQAAGDTESVRKLGAQFHVLMARLSGTVVRRPVDDVEDEIAAAEEAQREAKKAARKQLREARHKKRRDEVHAKIEELKAKLHLGRKPATTAS